MDGELRGDHRPWCLRLVEMDNDAEQYSNDSSLEESTVLGFHGNVVGPMGTEAYLNGSMDPT